LVVISIASRRNLHGWRFFFGMKIQKQTIGQLLFRAATALLVAGCAFIGCSSTPVDSQPSTDDCMDQVLSRVREAPEKEYLQTLDGQEVRLQDFFNQCRESSPDCVLFAKFYHWEYEVKQIVSGADSGSVEHQIRAYYNPLSICRPQKIHPGRTHGDVAEFYDAKGQFMGLAVYMGQGRYFLLHYSGYQNSEQGPK
jgi:hypothetical protein